MERSRLSSWRAMLSKFQNKKSKLTKQVSQLTKDITSLSRKIKDLEGKINSLTNSEIVICDHAKKRYRERFNPKATDQEIYKVLVTEELKEAVNRLGNLVYVADGIEIIIKDNTLVTVYDPKDKKQNQS